MSDMKRQIELYHLTKIYNNQKTSRKALAGVSFTLGPGLYGLLGPNGAGKSTMMNIITGNLDATSGKVLWNGKNVLRMGREFRRVLGYMPQQQNLYDVAAGLFCRKMDGRFCRKKPDTDVRRAGRIDVAGVFCRTREGRGQSRSLH